jgi:hypothetical protein
LLNRLLEADPDGWITAQKASKEKKNEDLWNGLDESDWMLLAEKDMSHVYNTVRKKGQFGGVLRRELYRRDYTDDACFYASVDALQAVTERLVQTALSVKTGEALASFNASAFFAVPTSKASKESLLLLDEKLNADVLSSTIGDSAEPTGLLRWLAHPTSKTLLQGIEDSTHLTETTNEAHDPRISWFL